MSDQIVVGMSTFILSAGETSHHPRRSNRVVDKRSLTRATAMTNDYKCDTVFIDGVVSSFRCAHVSICSRHSSADFVGGFLLLPRWSGSVVMQILLFAENSREIRSGGGYECETGVLRSGNSSYTAPEQPILRPMKFACTFRCKQIGACSTTTFVRAPSEATFWSQFIPCDNCSSQNHSLIVYRDNLCAMGRFTEILITYPIPGHSRMSIATTQIERRKLKGVTQAKFSISASIGTILASGQAQFPRHFEICLA